MKAGRPLLLLSRFFLFEQCAQRLDDMAAELNGRLELQTPTAVAGAFFQFIQLCLRVFVRLDHRNGQRVIVMNRKDEDGNATLHGAVELHFGDGDVVPFRYVAVTPGVDPDVDVGLVHHLQRDANGIRIARRQMLHRSREDALAQAGIDRFLAMLRQID